METMKEHLPDWPDDLESKVWTDLEEVLGRQPTEQEYEKAFYEAYELFMRKAEPDWDAILKDQTA